jgi:hypothetical protein
LIVAASLCRERVGQSRQSGNSPTCTENAHVVQAYEPNAQEMSRSFRYLKTQFDSAIDYGRGGNSSACGHSATQRGDLRYDAF